MWLLHRASRLGSDGKDADADDASRHRAPSPRRDDEEEELEPLAVVVCDMIVSARLWRPLCSQVK